MTRLKDFAPALKHIADIIERGIREHPELSVGMQTEGIEVKTSLRETERDRERQRETERDRERQTQRQRDKERERNVEAALFRLNFS